MTIDDFGGRVRDIGLRVDAADLAALEEKDDNPPMLSSAVGTGRMGACRHWCFFVVAASR